jgi:hypothetical protein
MLAHIPAYEFRHINGLNICLTATAWPLPPFAAKTYNNRLAG